MTLAALALLFSPVAMAVDVYVNGVLVNGLKDQELHDVTVTFDAEGNVQIDAPNVKIGRSGQVPVAQPAPVATESPATPSDVPAGRWWLVATDAGSRGVEIDVRINGKLVRVLSSGDAQTVLDLAPFLHRGPNQVTLTVRSRGKVGDKPFTVYVGSGSSKTGVLELSNPEISFAPERDDVRHGVTRVYTLTIN